MPQFGKQSTDAKKRLQHQLYLVRIRILMAVYIDICFCKEKCILDCFDLSMKWCYINVF